MLKSTKIALIFFLLVFPLFVLADITGIKFFQVSWIILLIVGMFFVIREEQTEKREHRDADIQSTPYTYKIGKHANEALAIRYGIANMEKKVKEYTYYGKGGIEKRNPDRDRVYYTPSSTITLRKCKSIVNDQYLVELTDHGNRIVMAVIEKGTEYVKTFLPISDEWFTKHAKLEETLKNNNSFSLKELARFHVLKAID